MLVTDLFSYDITTWAGQGMNASVKQDLPVASAWSNGVGLHCCLTRARGAANNKNMMLLNGYAFAIHVGEILKHSTANSLSTYDPIFSPLSRSI